MHLLSLMDLLRTTKRTNVRIRIVNIRYAVVCAGRAWLFTSNDSILSNGEKVALHVALHVQRVHSFEARKKKRVEQVQRKLRADGLEALGEALGELSDGEVGSVGRELGLALQDVSGH